MKFISRNLPYIAAAMLTLVVGVTAASVFGQNKADSKGKERSFCSNNSWSSGDHFSVSDLRETTVSATGTVAVDGRQNGGIAIRGEDRTDVLVSACVQAWGKSDEAAKALAAEVKIDTGSTIKAESPGENRNWSVSYDIRVPRVTNLNLNALNGGISITSVDSSANFETENGGVFLSDVSGSVKGHTTNGGVFVRLSGTSWKGNGLDVQTTNGGVNIEMPANYAARVEAGTVNGGFKSEIPSLNVTNDDRNGDPTHRERAKKISADINGSGAPIRVVTTNGGVKISTPNRSEEG